MGYIKRTRIILKRLCEHPGGASHVKVLYRFFKWQLFEKPFCPKGKSVNWIDGRKLLVFPGRTVSTGNYYLGLLEWEEMAFLLHYTREDDVVADCGANIGIYSILLGKICRHIFAFEPSTETAEILQRNLSVNNLTNVTVVKKGVGNKKCDGFFTKGLDATNHIVNNNSELVEENMESISIITLDEYMQNKPQITILKIDVEGSEENVLDGASSILDSDACNIVIMETFENKELVDRLLQKGFLLYKYIPSSRELISVNYNETGNNGIFVKDIEKAKTRITDAPLINIYGTWI